MNQYPSLQTEPNEFQQKLAALNPNDLNQFIFSVFFEEVGAVESEGEAWEKTSNAGQGDTDYLMRMESEFQVKLQAIKQNSEILLQDANARAREYVFQIKWWAQRLAEVERKSAERLAAVGGSSVPPPDPPKADPPTKTDLPTVSSGSAVDSLRAEFENPSPTSATPSPPSPARNALDNLRAELEGTGAPAPAAPLVNEKSDGRPKQVRSLKVDPAQLQELAMENQELRHQLEAEQAKSRSLEQEAATGDAELTQQLKLENEEMNARLQLIDMETASLRRDAQKSESLSAQLENLQLQMEAERAMVQTSAAPGPDQSQLEAEIEDLRNQLHAAELESQAIKVQSDCSTELAAQVESLTSEIQSLEERQPAEEQTQQLHMLESEVDELKGRLEIAQQIDPGDSEQVRSLLDEIEQLRTSVKEHESRETVARRESADPKVIADATSRVERAQIRAVELANLLHEPLPLIAAEVPIINENEPWALRERANLMEHILGEMERQRDEYYTPAQDASQQIIERLRRAGVNTEIYEDGLKVGNVNSSIMMERFLKDIEQRKDTAPARSANTPARLLEMLNKLELDVDEKLQSVHQRVVPTGLISIARKLIGEYLDGARPTDPQPTVRNIIRTVQGYLDSSPGN